MVFKRSAHRSSAKRGLGFLGAGSSILFGTAAMAASAAAIAYVAADEPDEIITDWFVAPLAEMGLITAPSSDNDDDTLLLETSAESDFTLLNADAPEAAKATVLAKPTAGINLSKPFYWTGHRAFSNLLAADRWRLKLPGQTKTIDMPANQMDANLNITRLNPGETVIVNLSAPTAINRKKSVNILCRWEGIGKVIITADSNVSNVSYASNTARFTQLPGNKKFADIQIVSIDESDPLRKLDCREADADPNALFDPTFLANVRKYNTLRYMWWQRTIDNAPVTWATRTRPDMAIPVGVDGIAIETMIELANQSQTNPWFAMPWNADEEYYRKFAELVRDRLDPSLKAYVEVSNEVWNAGYSATKQATAEGKAEGLAQPMPYRLAEKTGEVMDIWSSVFAGQETRLVRVLANQHMGITRMKQMLAYGDTASKIDAIATAPYFPFNMDKEKYNRANLQSVFNMLRSRIDIRMKVAIEFKALATLYGKRYIAYEAGQHVVGDAVNVNYKIQHDARMGELYTYYLKRWKAISGDLIVLFEDVNGATSPYGMFGQQDYPGQPLGQAPKANAVELFMSSIDNK